ncbi:MAG: porin family protein [Saprospiraceae bacterium]
MKTTRNIFAGLLILMTTSLLAQFNLGIKGGVNFYTANTKLYIDAIDNAPKTYTSSNWGLVSDIQLTNNISLHPELQFSKKGFVLDESTSFNLLGLDIPVGANITTQINYIEIPILLKATIGTGNVKGYGIIGPSIGHAATANIQPKVTLLIDWYLPKIDIDLNDDMYNRREISGIIGGGVEYQMNKGKLFTDLRYQYGFTNVFNQSTADFSVKMKGVQVSAGYMYRF